MLVLNSKHSFPTAYVLLILDNEEFKELPSCLKIQTFFCLAKHKKPLRSSQEYTLAPLALVITALVSKQGSLWNAINSESDRKSSLDSNTSIEIRGFLENPATFLSSMYGSLRTLGHERENRTVESSRSRRLLKRRF